MSELCNVGNERGSLGSEEGAARAPSRYSGMVSETEKTDCPGCEHVTPQLCKEREPLWYQVP